MPIVRRILRFLVLGAALLEADCAGVTGSSSGKPGNPGAPPPPPPPAQVTVTGSSNMSVTWQVNSVTGGAAPTGTISTSGVYIAPATLPSPNTVTVQAVSMADLRAVGPSSVTVWNPVPVFTTVSPMTVTQGAIAITVTGSNFVSGARVMLAGSPLTIISSSPTRLQAGGTAATVGMFAVTVVNPDPGRSTSNAINLQVTSPGGNPPPPPPLACSVMQMEQGGSLGGFAPFPADNLWNQDISSAPVDPNSAALIDFVGTGVGLHPGFGSGEFAGSIIGIPYQVVDSTQGPVTINFTEFGDESDPGPMPIPPNAPIEGYPNPSGDRHVLIPDNSNC